MTSFMSSLNQHGLRWSLLAAGILGLSLTAAPAHAQYTDAEVLAPNDGSQGFELNNMRSPLDLYHRANLANTVDPAEFMRYQRTLLNSEIENLRMQQQQLLQQRQSSPALEVVPAPMEEAVEMP
jgi:hypothetical protein